MNENKVKIIRVGTTNEFINSVTGEHFLKIDGCGGGTMVKLEGLNTPQSELKEISEK